jgi:histidinol-phosphate phosphatase family protein
MTVDLVIPTIGRASLVDLLCALSEQSGPLPDTIYLVDDRPERARPLIERGVDFGSLCGRIRVLRGAAKGPAAARNLGWRRSSADWVAFLDDDVVPQVNWLERLATDLASVPTIVAGSQGRLTVPLPADRRPTDWERNVSGLQGAPWITADMAYRRAVLQQLGGFDERFTRAFREDAELALRIIKAGYRIETGTRHAVHPIRQASPWVSLRAQAGNADDVLISRLHGADWYRQAASPKGRRAMHLTTVTALAVGVVGMLSRKQLVAAVGLGAWAGATAEFAWRRIAPGPRSSTEIAAMVATSVLIPPLALAHWLSGWWRWRSVKPLRARKPVAVLFDRDGTLVQDVPYNGDPRRVAVMPQARAALDRLRASGILVGVVSNQSGVARGVITLEQVAAVNRRLEELLGPMDSWAICPHGPRDACDCRKPAPGLVLRAAAELGVSPADCVVVGDIGSDVEAAIAAGARAILVPNGETRPQEVAAAPEVAVDLLDAVNRALRGTAA